MTVWIGCPWCCASGCLEPLLNGLNASVCVCMSVSYSPVQEKTLSDFYKVAIKHTPSTSADRDQCVLTQESTGTPWAIGWCNLLCTALSVPTLLRFRAQSLLATPSTEHAHRCRCDCLCFTFGALCCKSFSLCKEASYLYDSENLAFS